MKQKLIKERGITLVALIITIIILIILAAVTIKTVTDMKILEFAIKGTEDYSKAQDKEMEDFGKIENLLTDTISNIESGNTPTTPSEPDKPVNNPFTEEDIGKYVNYVPVGTEYTAEARYSGHTANQVFSQDTSLKWKIWKVENDTLYLISDGLPTKGGYQNVGKLLLADIQGYNNGVTLLDNICQANYGISGNNNVKVQNLKIEDVLAVKADEIKPESNYGTQPYTYPESGTFSFPSVWYNNERDNLELAEGNRSIAYPLVEIANSTITGARQQPYFTCWSNGGMGEIKAWKSIEYYEMVIRTANSREYWLSSRYFRPGSSTSYNIGLQGISGSVIGCLVYNYNRGNSDVSTPSLAIRPLVQIPLRNCEITENSTTENTFDIVIK